MAMQNPSCLQKLPANVTLGNVTQNCVWTITDLVHYCKLRHDYFRLKHTATYYLEVIELYFLLPIGLLANALLFFTLTFPLFRENTSFLYLRSVACAQFFRQALRILCHGTVAGQFSPFIEASISLYSRNLIRALRLVVISLSFFLTLDRFLIIIVPIWFSKSRARRLACIAMIVSFVIGCLYTEYWAEVEVRRVNGTRGFEYKPIFTPFGYNRRVFFRYISILILSIRAAEAVFMVIFGLAIVWALKRRGRRVKAMMSLESSHETREDLNRMSTFQIILTIDMVADAVVSCAGDGIARFIEPYYSAVASCRFSDQVQAMRYRRVFFGFAMTDLVSGSLAHCILFFLYLAFSRVFRQGFQHLMTVVLEKCGCSAVCYG